MFGKRRGFYDGENILSRHPYRGICPIQHPPHDLDTAFVVCRNIVDIGDNPVDVEISGIPYRMVVGSNLLVTDGMERRRHSTIFVSGCIRVLERGWHGPLAAHHLGGDSLVCRSRHQNVSPLCRFLPYMDANVHWFFDQKDKARPRLGVDRVSTGHRPYKRNRK